MTIRHLEGIRSERGIAWRVSDSLSLRSFPGVALGESTPDHSALSRTRKRLPLPIHQQVFEWVLARLGESGLVCGRTVGIDASTLRLRSASDQDEGRSAWRRTSGSYDLANT